MTGLFGIRSSFPATSLLLDLDKQLVWEKGDQIPGLPASEYRRDCDRRTIRYAEYGMYSDFGWHFDHILPKALGGSDDVSNLRPRHWRGNTSAGGLLGALLDK